MYRALLYLYPASWRDEYGQEMLAVFAQRRQARPGLFAAMLLWLEALADSLYNAAAAHLDLLAQDLKYAFRAFRRSPGFALAAVAIAALGIGATTAAFTLVDYTLIRPLPFAHSDRLVRLYQDRSPTGPSHLEASPGVYRAWKQASASFESMGAYRPYSVNLTGQGEPITLDGAALTSEILPMLGIRPAFGRLFTQQDDRDSAPATAILSYGVWQRVFGGDPAVLGRVIDLYDTPYTVIGVMPKAFYFPSREAEIWTAMRFRPADFEDLDDTYIYPLGLMKAGLPLTRVRAEMRTIATRFSLQHPKELPPSGATTVLLRDDFSEQSKLMLKVLLGAALCVLLIACGNLANLLLARAMVRRRELAVRTALGAGRERLVRQTLTESLLLAFGGGALGLFLALAGLPLFAKLAPARLPLAEVPTVDGRMLAFAALLTLATGILFGVAPAVRVCRRDQTLNLHEGGRSGVGGRRERLRSGLVIAEIAISLVLLVGFGLLARSLWRIQENDPGFRADHALTLRTALPWPRYQDTSVREPFYRRVLDDVRRLPGVTGAAYITALPMTNSGGIWTVDAEGQPEELGHRRGACLRFVTPGYFAAMNIPLLSGRDVDERDSDSVPYIAVVSQSFARRYWGSQSPIGRHIKLGAQDRTIVGVVGDVRFRGLDRESEPQVYASWKQPKDVAPWYAPKDLVVRAAGDPMQLVSAIRGIVRSTDPNQPITDVQPLQTLVEAGTSGRRVQLLTLGIFGAVAFLLAAVGMHGLLSFAVSSRIQEIGVRIALGAHWSNILGLTVGGGLRLAAIGIVAGAAMAYPTARLLQTLLAGVRPDDFSTFGAAAGMALVIALIGSALPAMRALRVDAATAIRNE
jgi:predicted permease